MQWGQIKTLFILCFLILDIFLIQQFLVSREPDIPYLPESTVEEIVKTNIKGVEDIPTETTQASYLYASRKQFTEEEKAMVSSFTNQETEIVNNNLIVSLFKEPLAYNQDNPSDILPNYVLYSDQYVYWGKNDASNTLIYFQKSDDKPIYYNSGGILLIFLNEEGEMVQYVQTMLTKEEDEEDQYDLINAFDAVTYLYRSNSLIEEDEITDYRIGYHTVIPLYDGVQVFAPAWKITVNGQKNYIVNAIEGHSYPKTDNVFISETIDEFLQVMEEKQEPSSLLSKTINRLTTIMESD
ncbi:two-component system regulatory protein YycI [Radiobacillus sp. PE A8.2]|uniref:two-component system regulatory protein YycI n=1 Tax=Radiobacillus sp. PE A8.2 TaxID=3380349 RepID=UPI00388E9ACF